MVSAGSIDHSNKFIKMFSKIYIFTLGYHVTLNLSDRKSLMTFVFNLENVTLNKKMFTLQVIVSFSSKCSV